MAIHISLLFEVVLANTSYLRKTMIDFVKRKTNSLGISSLIIPQKGSAKDKLKRIRRIRLDGISNRIDLPSS